MWPNDLKDQWERTQARKQAQKAGPNKYTTTNEQAGKASAFAGQGEAGFSQLGQESADFRKQLGRYARGEDSLSAEQLRQGLQQNLAAQQSMAASAAPANAAMAARTAAMQMGRQGMGLSGQQAMAGIAERQAAMQALGNMIGQQRQMEPQAALGGRGQAIDAYGNVLNGKIQQAAKPSGWDKALGAIIPAAGIAASIATGNPAPAIGAAAASAGKGGGSAPAPAAPAPDRWAEWWRTHGSPGG